jgi:nucleotide-binding universal stress UspA family protein
MSAPDFRRSASDISALSDDRMRLKDILVFLDAGADSEGRLKLATAIARHHRAYLEAIFLPPVEKAHLQSGIGPSQFLGSLATRLEGGIIELPKVAMLADIAESRFHDHLRLSGIGGKWQLLHGAKAAELIAHAPAVDLIVLGQTDRDARRSDSQVLWPEKIVVGCGRPALLVPYIGSYPDVGRRVLIAWDGSPAAVRAVNDALPLMRDAETVTVMTVRRSERAFAQDRSSMERVVEHLARHGVIARPDRVLHGGSPIFEVLLSRAMDIAAGLIVAGAYHHSPMREVLTGGVSRGLFRHMTVPVLMSH